LNLDIAELPNFLSFRKLFHSKNPTVEILLEISLEIFIPQSVDMNKVVRLMCKWENTCSFEPLLEPMSDQHGLGGSATPLWHSPCFSLCFCLVHSFHEFGCLVPLEKKKRRNCTFYLDLVYDFLQFE